MSESSTLHMSHSMPATTYLNDYQVPAYLIDTIQLHVDLFDTHAKVTSQLQIRRNAASEATSHELILNGAQLTLESIKLNDTVLYPNDYTVTDHTLTIHHPPEQCSLEIVTKIFPQLNTELTGLYRSGNTFCTQCESEGFRKITYFIDRPDVLSRYTTTISADEKKYPYLLSNGNQIATGQLEGGRHWATWEDPFKKPSYLFALVAGDFDLLEDQFVTQSGRPVQLKIYVDKGYRDQTHHAMYAVKEAMRWDERTYGREYDLDVFMLVAIGDFNSGAMENKGLNIFNTKYVLAKPETATDDDYIHILSVIGHEYFHNWSGNRVTCRDWFQLSLKEGLTIFRDQSFLEDTLSRGVMRIRDVVDLRESQFPEDAGPLAHPVLPDAYIEINNFYTATIYNKGAEVLRMLQHILGKTLFRAGMDLYFSRYDGQAVTIDDYVATMEEVSGLDLTQFRRWYHQAGTPLVTVQDDYDSVNKTYTLNLQQSTSPTPQQAHKLPLDIPIRMGLLDQQGRAISLHIDNETPVLEKVLRLNQTMQSYTFNDIPSRPVPSLLRGFSAPVKLSYPYSQADLQFLMQHDSDAFNRWEAGQKYAINTILNLVTSAQQDEALILPPEVVKTYELLLTHEEPDYFFLSEMFAFPSENYLGEQMEVVDVDAIHAAREFLLDELAVALQEPLLQIYQRYHGVAPEYRFDADTVGKRQLKNRALSLLMRVPKYISLGMQQFESSLTNNMTDTLAALAGLVNQAIPERKKALDAFYQAWKHEPLVMDKWFSIQATTKLPDALDQVKKLMRHPAFDIKNPNKVYSLIGAFGNRNPVNFHAQNGEGYAFLREVVQQLDRINPHMSARMVKPLTPWKRYDKERQSSMRDQLSLLLLDKNISTDLYELVTKAIEG